LLAPTDQLATTFSFPSNLERAYLDVITQSQIDDEFWYTCVPNDISSEVQKCGGTAFREAEVSVDGQPAGVAPVYPGIYTGGVDPFLWEPIPAVQTLNFVPYRVDLTPFAGILSNGQPHTIALSVFNSNNYFSATAILLKGQHGSPSNNQFQKHPELHDKHRAICPGHSQDTNVESQTITWSGFGSFVSLETFHYPLTMNRV
jgi:hypothetical protein